MSAEEVATLTCDGCQYEGPSDLLDPDPWWHTAERPAYSTGEGPQLTYCGFCYHSTVGYSLANYPGQEDRIIGALYAELTRHLNRLRAEVLEALAEREVTS